MPDNQFNPGPYGSASTSYSSASGPNPQSAPSAATTWASPGQNAGILPPTNQKSLIGKPGLGLSVFWLVLGLITLAVGAGLASLNLTDATLPSLSSFSPGTSKSAQLEANRTYAFYAASTKLDSARQTSCVVSGPDGYSPTVTKANSSEELKVSRSYYKVATFSPNKSGSYSFACSNPNIDRADVFAIADITDTTTVTSSNDLIYARIFVGAGAFLGLVGLGLGIFGVIALVRKLKARRNFTDGLPAQGEDSASASSGAFSGYVPTTPGQDPLGFQAQGVASQGPGAAAPSRERPRFCSAFPRCAARCRLGCCGRWLRRYCRRRRYCCHRRTSVGCTPGAVGGPSTVLPDAGVPGTVLPCRSKPSFRTRGTGFRAELSLQCAGRERTLCSAGAKPLRDCAGAAAG